MSTTRTKLVALVCTAALAIGVTACGGGPPGPTSSTTAPSSSTTVPSSTTTAPTVTTSCASGAPSQTASFTALLASIPDGTSAAPDVYTLPAGNCYVDDGTAVLQGPSYVTINGNGDTIQQEVDPSYTRSCGSTETTYATTLSTALTTSAAVTDLDTAALTIPAKAGTITVTSGANTETFTATAATAKAGTSFTVSSVTPTFAFPVGSTVTYTIGYQSGVWCPMLDIFQTTGVTFENLNLVGFEATLPADGGADGEPKYGIVEEQNDNLTLSDVNISDVGGDFFSNQPSKVHETPLTGSDSSGNPYPTAHYSTNVTITGSDWDTAGYHGITLEAIDGFTFDDDTLSNANTDAIDMEYDGNVDSPAAATNFPQENVTFNDDTFANDGTGVVLNLDNTGQLTQANIAFTNNTLTGDTYATFDLWPSNCIPSGDSCTSSANWSPVTNVTITGNTSAAAMAGPTPFDGINLRDVQGATIEDNTFPYYGTSKTAVIATNSSTGIDVEGDTFDGAATVQSGAAVDCGNTYGAASPFTTEASCDGIVRRHPRRPKPRHVHTR